MIQPRARYVRSLVKRKSPGAPDYAGIVIESWPSKKHMDNPFYFFNASHPLQLIENIIVLLWSVTSFTSLFTFQGSSLSEYLFHNCDESI